VRLLAPAALVLLCACGQASQHGDPGEVTGDEARAIEEAAQMLDERRLSPEQLRNVPAVDTAPLQGKAAQGAPGDAGR
jgi:hypothetical protein